ncbi:hypothetical protein Tco_1359602 [Tanacetum coccineum]
MSTGTLSSKTVSMQPKTMWTSELWHLTLVDIADQPVMQWLKVGVYNVGPRIKEKTQVTKEVEQETLLIHNTPRQHLQQLAMSSPTKPRLTEQGCLQPGMGSYAGAKYPQSRKVAVEIKFDGNPQTFRTIKGESRKNLRGITKHQPRTPRQGRRRHPRGRTYTNLCAKAAVKDNNVVNEVRVFVRSAFCVPYRIRYADLIKVQKERALKANEFRDWKSSRASGTHKTKLLSSQNLCPGLSTDSPEVERFRVLVNTRCCAKVALRTILTLHTTVMKSLVRTTKRISEKQVLTERTCSVHGSLEPQDSRNHLVIALLFGVDEDRWNCRPGFLSVYLWSFLGFICIWAIVTCSCTLTVLRGIRVINQFASGSTIHRQTYRFKSLLVPLPNRTINSWPSMALLDCCLSLSVAFIHVDPVIAYASDQLENSHLWKKLHTHDLEAVRQTVSVRPENMETTSCVWHEDKKSNLSRAQSNGALVDRYHGLDLPSKFLEAQKEAH